MNDLKNIATLCLISLLFTTTIQAQWWKGWGYGIKGEGSVVSKTYDFEDFEKLSMAVSADVELRIGKTQSVEIKAQQNILDNLDIEVSGNKLRIRNDRNVRSAKRIKIYITMTNIKGLAVAGSGTIKGIGTFSNLANLDLAIAGSGDMYLDVEAQSVESAISGSGTLSIKGKTDSYEAAVSGSGDVFGYDFTTNRCAVAISGSGTCKITVNEKLKARVSGSGDVYYKGSVKQVDAKVSGSGDVEQVN